MTISASRTPAPARPAAQTRGLAGARRALAAAACAAILALVAAAVAAVGPARAESAEYTWPPVALPASNPDRGWFAPLPLLNRVPSSIAVRLPCGLAPPLRQQSATTVLATARLPGRHDGLRVTLARGSMLFGVGGAAVARAPWPGSCPLDVEVADGELRLPGRVVPLRTDTLDDMPIVTGLFTNLDLRAGERPNVVVRARPFETSQTMRQGAAAVLAVLFASIALLLIARLDPRRRAAWSVRRGVARAWAARDATDAVVVGTLLVWWIFAPTHFDDGWLWVTSHVFADVPTSYFYNWGVNAPVGYWLEWMRHWVVGSTSHLVVARVPSLLSLLAAWALCRWSLHHVVAGRPSGVTRWALAGAFLVGATSWGMTIRPEPFIVLLAAASLAAMVSFARTPGFVPVVIAVVAAILATTAHPAGVVAAAPILAAAPEAFRWLREGGIRLVLALGALLVAGLALAMVAFTLDADLQTRIADAQVVSEGPGHGTPWWREYVRYERFDDFGGATAIRRLGLALLLWSVAAWLTRRRAVQTGVLLLPARSVAVALPLLAFVPSKWAAHFGTLAAVGAVAVAAEVARLVRESDLPGRPPLRLMVALPLFGVVAVWAWTAPGRWSLLDLQEVRWSDGFGVNGWGSVALAAVLVAVLVVRSRRKHAASPPGPRIPAVTAWAIPTMSFAVVGVTIALLAVDAALTSWSPPRQNLEVLAGGDSCGLAHQLRGEDDFVDLVGDPGTIALLEPPVALYFPCATTPGIGDGVVEIPTLVVYQSGPWPVEDASAPFAAVSDLYRLETVAAGPGGVVAVSVDDDVPGFGRLDASRHG